MQRLGALMAMSTAGVIVLATALPAAAGPDDGGAEVSVSPGSITAGAEFSVTVSGCTSGQQLQVQIDPAGVVASASCDGTPGFASAQFLAGGPLGAEGVYDVIVLEAAAEIGRTSVEVTAAAGVEDKRAAKAERNAAAAAARGAAGRGHCHAGGAGRHAGGARRHAAQEQPATADQPASAPALDDPAAEPREQLGSATESADESTLGDDPAAEPEPDDVVVASTVPVMEDGVADDDLAATGPASSTAISCWRPSPCSPAAASWPSPGAASTDQAWIGPSVSRSDGACSAGAPGDDLGADRDRRLLGRAGADVEADRRHQPGELPRRSTPASAQPLHALVVGRAAAHHADVADVGGRARPAPPARRTSGRG